MAATAGQNALEGRSTTIGQLAVSGGGGVLGSLSGSAIGVAAGDFSQAAAQGVVQRMAGHPINSPAGIGVHIAETTLKAGPVGTRQGSIQAAASQAGQSAMEAVVSERQKVVEDKIK